MDFAVHAVARLWYDGKMDNQFRIVDVVDETTMDGDTLLERRLNAYLTKRFILGSNVPSDECLSEAKEVIRIVKEFENKGSP